MLPKNRGEGVDRRAFLAGGAAAGAPLANIASIARAQSVTPSTLGALTPARLADLEREARAALGEGPFAFVSGGAGSEWTLRENRRAFERYVIQPEHLSGRGAPNLSTTILGSTLSLPVITAPMGAQAIIHASADVGMAAGTAASGTLMTMSGAALPSIEAVAAAATGPKWYQLYLPEDQGQARALLQRAKASGFTAIVFTIDALGPGNSDAFDRSGFNLTQAMAEAQARLGPPSRPASRSKRGLSWADLAFVQKESGLPVILKGVLTPEAARRAVQAGVAGVQVSNHGGRQIDGVPAALDALPPIVAAVAGKVPVLMDSGVRRGVDVFKALALGAKAVAVGRPLLYGLALGGAPGVQSVYDRLKLELTMAMQGAGVDRVDQITGKHVRRA